MLVQAVDGDSGLDVAGAGRGVHRADGAAGCAHVDDDGVVGALSGEGGATAAWEHRDAPVGAPLDDPCRIVDAGGNDDADRLDLVERGIGGVEQPVMAAEADLAAGLVRAAAGREQLAKAARDPLTLGIPDRAARARDAPQVLAGLAVIEHGELGHGVWRVVSSVAVGCAETRCVRRPFIGQIGRDGGHVRCARGIGTLVRPVDRPAVLFEEFPHACSSCPCFGRCPDACLRSPVVRCSGTGRPRADARRGGSICAHEGRDGARSPDQGRGGVADPEDHAVSIGRGVLRAVGRGEQQRGGAAPVQHGSDQRHPEVDDPARPERREDRERAVWVEGTAREAAGLLRHQHRRQPRGERDSSTPPRHAGEAHDAGGGVLRDDHERREPTDGVSRERQAGDGGAQPAVDQPRDAVGRAVVQPGELPRVPDHGCGPRGGTGQGARCARGVPGGSDQDCGPALHRNRHTPGRRGVCARDAGVEDVIPAVAAGAGFLGADQGATHNSGLGDRGKYHGSRLERRPALAGLGAAGELSDGSVRAVVLIAPLGERPDNSGCLAARVCGRDGSGCGRYCRGEETCHGAGRNPTALQGRNGSKPSTVAPRCVQDAGREGGLQPRLRHFRRGSRELRAARRGGRGDCWRDVPIPGRGTGLDRAAALRDDPDSRDQHHGPARLDLQRGRWLAVPHARRGDHQRLEPGPASRAAERLRRRGLRGGCPDRAGSQGGQADDRIRARP